ncbi:MULTISPECIES: gas vesicle protein GvpG [unclassified Streptomyces]|uniref:gas vesicle protein GvpG n=1 Tax=unclassified Streptomyces TaxID=2593676 RepID=UPI0008894411|nr:MULTISPECIES: gas vesicle protein GvpG [unclassified Streptomyces]PBC80670.1 gas vesicle protein GvpG [Streptomyces sp. 2321.6]SDR57700.1 Gas vesicle protein G [Streptomyces sp. KS_16]SEB83919.1 Gas vesicle protein G [Streptomyces sp. 2133.1]SEF13576.1 Gas vesicle protein G [Streptomyces sp. 2112.3]SNC61574.1 Gas vesicle protein G [Streptomyces sp. 2114.4]
MGLITQILTLPAAPVRGTVWVLDQVLLTAEREYYDPEPVREELAVLEQQLLDGSITSEEFDSREDELLDRLEWLEANQQRLRTDS